MDDMIIKVSTEELENASAEVFAVTDKMRNVFASIEQIIRHSVSYWEGAGNNAYRDSYQRKHEELMLVLKKFTENASDLEEIAGVYRNAESENKNESDGLLSDIFS